MKLAAPLLALALGACDGWPESPPPTPPVPPPFGSVPQGDAARRAALAAPAPPSDPALSRRGAERYAIFCAPCHGARGRGDGVVVAHGHPPIAPLPAEPARSLAALANNHLGAHPMAERLDPRDRWAVALHVATLAATPR